MADTKKILPYVVFGVPIAIGLYFVYKAVKNKFGKGQDAPPNYDTNNNGNVETKPNGTVTPSVAKLFPLKKGSKGGKVIELQNAILLYDSTLLGKYGADGDFGTITANALQTILGKTSADSQDDIDAIVKKANEKKKNQATQVQVDNTNNNRTVLGDKLIAEYNKNPSSKSFYALHKVKISNWKQTSDGRKKDEKFYILENGDRIKISGRTSVVNRSGFINVFDANDSNYWSFSAYGFEVR
tara:strand:+ start:7164 stop:7886 length:723 start_codon:yes stop_codon:yes gene_type:complete